MTVVRLLAISLLLVTASTGRGDERGSATRIDRFLTAYYKNPKDVKVVTELGANFAVKYSDSGALADKTQAHRYLGEAQKLDPKMGAAVAWMGLLQCVQARESMTTEVAQQGLEKMDWALKQEPDNLDLRILRASVAIEAPAEFNRLPQSIEDLDFVRKRVEADPKQGVLYGVDPAEVYLSLGNAHKSKGDLALARSMWERAVLAGGPGPYPAKASRQLKKHPAPR